MKCWGWLSVPCWYLVSSTIRKDCLEKNYSIIEVLTPSLADEAFVVMRRHCWCLSWSSPPCFLPSYSQMRSPGWHTIINLRGLKSYPLEKLKFPAIDDITELVDLIPAESFKFFEILHLNHSWLAMKADK